MSKQKQLELSIVTNEVFAPENAKLPTILSHAPFFKPSSRTKNDAFGWRDEDGESFSIGNVEWIRFGPGLDTYDLATLAAIYQIVNSHIKGPKSMLQRFERSLIASHGRSLPATFDDLDGSSDDVSMTFEEIKRSIIGVTTPYSINRYLGRGTDNNSIRSCRDSIMRLSKTQSVLHNRNTGRRDENVPFFLLSTNKSGAMVISIPSEMLFLFAHLIRFDLAIYSQLSPLGQSMMLWLNPLSGNVELELTEAKRRAYYNGEMKDFKRALVTGTKRTEPVLPQMKTLGFIKGWEITGTGRKIPFSLTINR